MRTIEDLIKIKPIFKELENKFTDKDIKYIVDEMVEYIVDSFYTGNKYTHTHDYDPPYDCSGELINEHKSFDINDYKNVGDFLEEYIGNSKATYNSGCGLYYDTYDDIIKEECENLVFEKCKRILCKKLNMNKEEIKDLWFDFFSEFDNEFYDDLVFEILYNKVIPEIDKLKELNFKSFINENQPTKEIT